MSTTGFARRSHHVPPRIEIRPASLSERQKTHRSTNDESMESKQGSNSSFSKEEQDALGDLCDGFSGGSLISEVFVCAARARFHLACTINGRTACADAAAAAARIGLA